MNIAVFLIGALFSPIAAIMAYLITYGAYRHHYAENRLVIKNALISAFITLSVFLVLSLIISVIINKIK